MDFGVVLQTNPPAARTVQLAKLAEAHGFNHVVDVRLAPPLGGAVRHPLGDPRRDEPGDRRPVRHQPRHAGLDGDGIRLRHLERDVRQPHHLRHRPRRLGRARHQRQAGHDERAAGVDPRHPRAREFATGGVQRRDDPVPMEPRLEARRLGRRVRAARAEADRRGGRRVHPAAGRPRRGRVDDQDRPGCRCRRRPRPRLDRLLRRCADVHRRRLAAHARPVPLVRRDGRQPRRRHRGEVRPPRRRERRSGRAHRLHRGTRRLRLQHPRQGGQRPRRLRARRDRRPLLHPGHRGGAHREAREAARTRGRPSSRATSSTTTRRRRCASTERRSFRRSPSTWWPSDDDDPRAHPRPRRAAARQASARGPVACTLGLAVGSGRNPAAGDRMGALQVPRSVGRGRDRGGAHPAAHHRPRDAARLGHDRPAAAARDARRGSPPLWAAIALAASRRSASPPSAGSSGSSSASPSRW